MPKYHIWTIGCQMNKAESEYIEDFILRWGFDYTPVIKDADLIIVNTCVVRQSAEDKVVGLLNYLKGVKQTRPGVKIIVTGCYVDSNIGFLKNLYPHIDMFFKAGYLQELYDSEIVNSPNVDKEECLHLAASNSSCCALVPIIQGCNNFCSYCIVPYRRGRERSRGMEDIYDEVMMKVKNGVKEITLLGQNVNSYGNDMGYINGLGVLLQKLNPISGLKRIRFLTNHPKDMSKELIDSISSLDKVCRHINLPLQAGSNTVLNVMGRGYTTEQYEDLVSTIRKAMPDVSISTDIIVGFPGETVSEFEETLELINRVNFDVVHTAMYSPRAGTLASSKYQDNISQEEKKRRFLQIESTQEGIAAQINNALMNLSLQVLIEGQKNHKWYGRTKSNKLVFIKSDRDLTGSLVEININKTSAWALQGELIN